MKLPSTSALLIHVPSKNPTAFAQRLKLIQNSLHERDIPVITAEEMDDVKFYVRTRPDIGCILLGWNGSYEFINSGMDLGELIHIIHEQNEFLPIFLLTERIALHDLPHSILHDVSHTVWVTEDEPDLISGRIEQAIYQYRRSLLPPFFARLYDYVQQYKYSWHTPGHSGGMAYLKSPVGRVFYDFFGRNIFLSDLSSSVPDLGSILEHEGVVKDAEEEAAKAFGADRTYFVTNGTTMANQIVIRSIVRPGDVILVDRNCHKSIVNACIMVGAIPIFLQSMRNAQGIIGPIKWDEFDENVIREKMYNHPLITDPEHTKIRMAIITNSTYDGVMYNTERVLDKLAKFTDYVLFDEAWIPYAAFADIYKGYFGMSIRKDPALPTVISDMSTHKTLAAFSQASMIHIRDGRSPLPHHRFNETYMMHMSTSPQYSIIASLDVATRMMEGNSGKQLVLDAINEAIDFRKEIRSIHDELTNSDDWWFDVWQPDQVGTGSSKTSSDERIDFLKMDPQQLSERNEYWKFTACDKWHGFDKIADDYVMLDPVKVTVLTPGVNNDGTIQEWGIPASLVTSYLREHGVVVEKTGTYSFLVLFTIAVDRGKSSTLITRLYDFKYLYDHNKPIKEVLPSIYRQHPDRYAGVGIRDLANEMHQFLSKENPGHLLDMIYGRIPTPVMTPGQAYIKLVSGEVELVPLDQLEGHVAAVLCLVYPPGIPVVVPGERFDSSSRAIVDYLKLFQNWDIKFPGFENEVQGVVKEKDNNGNLIYSVYCAKEISVEENLSQGSKKQIPEFSLV